MYRLSRRNFLHLCTGTAAGLWLTGCTPIQAPAPAEAPIPEARVLTPLPLVEPVEINQLTAEQEDKLKKVIDFFMGEYKVPGLGVGIVRNGEVVYAKGFGVAEIGTDTLITTQSVFQIMDLTRTFTAAAAMQLVEQGKLDLDAPVVEVLPYFQLADDRYTQITLRHLLTESAGLPSASVFTPSEQWEGKTRQTDDAALERYVRSLKDVTLSADPGAASFFCNMGYDIAGDMVAKASGEVFEEYMAQHILRPLGMASSTFYPEEVDPAVRVTPHVVAAAAAAVSDLVTYSRERSPSVGLFTNVADLNRWLQATLNRGELDGVRILQDASYDAIWSSRIPIQAGDGNDYQFMGLGWVLGTNRERPIRQLDTTAVGFHAGCYLYPDDRTGALVLGNQWTAAGVTEWYAPVIAKTAIDIVER